MGFPCNEGGKIYLWAIPLCKRPLYIFLKLHENKMQHEPELEPGLVECTFCFSHSATKTAIEIQLQRKCLNLVYGQIPYTLQANPLIIKGVSHSENGNCPHLEKTFLTIEESLNLCREFLLQDLPLTRRVKIGTEKSLTNFAHSHNG